MNLRQPYVQKNATGYHSIPSHDKNIFSYYIFQEEPTTLPIHAVPDGCVDLTYAIGANGVRCFLGGTVLRMKYWPFEASCRYFGVRFRPGQCILPDGICIDDIVNTDIELPTDCYGTDIAEQLCEAKTLKEQAAQIHTMLSRVSRSAACKTAKHPSNTISASAFMKQTVRFPSAKFRRKPVIPNAMCAVPSEQSTVSAPKRSNKSSAFKTRWTKWRITRSWASLNWHKRAAILTNLTW